MFTKKSLSLAAYGNTLLLQLRCRLRWFLPLFRAAIPILSFAALFLLSTTIYLFSRSHKSYTLLFPNAYSKYDGQDFSSLYAEQRKIPIPHDLPLGWNAAEREIYYLLKELLYGPGPGLIRSYPFVPNGTKLNSLALQNRNLYLDFDDNLTKGEAEHHFATAARLALIKKVLRLNFPKLKGIYFTFASSDIQKFTPNLPESEKPS